jgi:hypothetical protein
MGSHSPKISMRIRNGRLWMKFTSCWKVAAPAWTSP